MVANPFTTDGGDGGGGGSSSGGSTTTTTTTTTSQPSSIQTTLATGASAGGSVVVVSGTTSGAQGRTVTVKAEPQAGYVFDHWIVETTAVHLPLFANTSLPTSLDNVCTESWQNAAIQLFSDGTQLYTDNEGKYPASQGYYGAGGGRYYNYTGRIPTLQTCSNNSTNSTGVTTNTGSTVSGGSSACIPNNQPARDDIPCCSGNVVGAYCARPEVT